MGKLKNVLLTGATGFVGSHLLSSLIKNGYLVIAYLRPASNDFKIGHLKNNYSSFVTPDNSQQQIETLFEKYQIEAVVHTATEYGREKSLSAVIETNVLFPLRLLEVGIKNGLKLFINTDTFFGKKDFELQYLNNYVTSKRLLESLIPEFSNLTKIANFRLEHVYGENDSEAKFVTTVLKQCIKNSKVIDLTEGLQKRDFIYIDDVVDAYITILNNEHLISGYKEYEVGTGTSVTVRDFVSAIGELSESKTLLNFGAIPERIGEIKDSFADINLLKSLGWQPKFDMRSAINKILKIEKKRFINEI